MNIIGIMSGTSFDAIETAAADLRLDGETLVLRPLGSRTFDHDPKIQAEIAAVLPPAATTVEAVCKLDARLGKAFAEAAYETDEAFCEGRADLVVSHGQTVFHWVEGGRAMGTLQLGDPACISERTGSPALSDLRSRDIAAGGHGAPLASLFDALLLAGGTSTRAALNLGGIANLTIVPPEDPPFAFDSGPANALIDAAVSHLTNGAEAYDKDGERATRGEVHKVSLRELLDHPYFDLDPPKSTGKELFNLSYLMERAESGIPDDDLVATATALTAKTVGDALIRYGVDEVVASGGGTSNPTLMDMLRREAPSIRLRNIEEWGIPSEAKEAYVFAVLGFLSAHGLPGALPSCTGARRATILGNFTPGRGPLSLPAPVERGPTSLRIRDAPP